jgi:hypothetical protein
LTFGLSLRLCSFLKLLGEWHVVEEDPRVVKFVVPCPFQVAHAWKQLVQLFVPHEGDDGRIGSGGVGAVRSVVVFVGAPQIAIRLTGCYISKTVSAQPKDRKIDHEEMDKSEGVRSFRGSAVMPLYSPGPMLTYEGLLFIWNTRKITSTTHAAESMRIGLATAMLTVLRRNDDCLKMRHK